MVITNNINVVNILLGYRGIEVVVAGGLVRHADGGIVGEAAVDSIREFRADYAIVGSSAIDSDGTLLDFDYREVKVTNAILQSARCSILVCDSSKYDRAAPVRIGHLSALDFFVTDKPPPASIQSICCEHNVEIIIAAPTDSM